MEVSRASGGGLLATNADLARGRKLTRLMGFPILSGRDKITVVGQVSGLVPETGCVAQSNGRGAGAGAPALGGTLPVEARSGRPGFGPKHFRATSPEMGIPFVDSLVS